MNPTLTFELFSCFSSSTKLDNATTAQLSLWKKLWSQDALDFFPFKKVFIFSQEGQTKEQKNLKKLPTFVSTGNAKSKQTCFSCSSHMSYFANLDYLIPQDSDVLSTDHIGGVKLHKYEEK